MIHLQIGNGLVGPVGVLDLVQLGLGESVVQVIDGHLIERDHVVKLGQLRFTQKKNETRDRKQVIDQYRQSLMIKLHYVVFLH